MNFARNITLALSAALALSAEACLAADEDPASESGPWKLATEARVDSSGIFLNQTVIQNPPVVLPQIRLAPAPPQGQTSYLTREQIIALAGTNFPALNTTNWSGPARVRITRRMRPLEETELAQLLTDAFQRDYVKDLGELELRFSRPWQTITVPDEPLSLTIADVPANGLNPTFVTAFELWNGKERVGRWQAVLQAKVWRPVPVSHSPLMRGTLLADADVTLERRDLLTVRDAFLNFSKDDRTQELTENISTGMPVSNHAVHPRPAIRRGQLVDGVYMDGSLIISLKVETLEDGVPGQIVRVRNPKTNREIYGKVQNEETVRITL